MAKIIDSIHQMINFYQNHRNQKKIMEDLI